MAEMMEEIPEEKEDERSARVEDVDIKAEEKLKQENSVKVEDGHAKAEWRVKSENADFQVKGEDVKNELPLAKFEQVKAEEALKKEVKRERSRSRDRRRKDKKIKREKERSASRQRRKDRKEKRRQRDPDKGAGKKRKTRWGPDTGGFSMTVIPAGRSGMLPTPATEDSMPKFTEEEMVQRVLIIENLTLSVTGQELIEFFNGAILAVTSNVIEQGSSRSMAPVFAISMTEEELNSGERKKSAELKLRTPDGAAVGMKLNGIDYKSRKLTIRRPDDYVYPEDGRDPHMKISLQDMTMARLVEGAEDSGKQEYSGPPVKMSIFNLPEVMTEQVVRDLLSQFGRLRMCNLIRDLATGKIKGYGLFEYENPRDVDLAVIALNGFVCGQNVIRVQKLGGQTNQAQPKAQPVAATSMANSMTQKIVSNPVLAMQVKQGREAGSRPSTIVQLLNAVYQEDLMDDQDYEDIAAEIHSEACKHGVVQRVVIPKPAKDGTYTDHVGKIFVAFHDLTAARKFQLETNGRKFENRVVCSAFYPVDKFNEGKYSLWST